jgi:hypothetical protein
VIGSYAGWAVCATNQRYRSNEKNNFFHNPFFSTNSQNDIKRLNIARTKIQNKKYGRIRSIVFI